MITTKKRLLVTDSQEIAKVLNCFEGLKQITDAVPEEIQRVYGLNKTPFILSSKLPKIPEAITIPLFSDEFDTVAFTRWCNFVGVDPGEYLTGKRIDTSKEKCVLCNLVGHKGFDADTMEYNKVTTESDMIVYESEHFIVVPELGSVIPGFLMIVPKMHKYLSVAQMLEAGEFEDELNEVCHDLQTLLQGAFHTKRVVTYFEHGSGPSGITVHPKSIVHWHIHVALGFKIKERYRQQVQMQPCPDLKVASHTHYFAYREGADGEIFCVYDDEVYVPRQYPRKIMTLERNLAPYLYDWRKARFDENIKSTLFAVYDYLLTACKEERIIERTSDFVVAYAERISKSENEV